MRKARFVFPLPACILLLLGVTACSRGPAAPATSESVEAPKPQTSSAMPQEVTLTEAAQQNAKIRSETVELSDLAMTITANGQVMPNEDRTFRVGSVVVGKVRELNVNLGDRVKEGQILMRMHSHEVHDTRAAYVMAREALRQAEDKSALALRVRDRARRLLALEAISKEQVDQAETEWKSSAAAVDSARAQVDRERTHLVDVLEVPLDKSGNPEDIDTVPVRAPAAGVVIERKATVGSVFSSGDVMLTITDPSTLWVIVNANEVDLPALRPGQRASVQVRAYPDRNFTGQIARLGESLDPVTRTLQVRVVVPNREGLLKPEMFATVTIARNAARKAITVPRDSVQDVNGQQSVFVQKSNQQFRQQVVKLGQSVADRVEVVSGLQPGDRVVVRGSFEVKSELLKSSLKEE